MKKVDDLDISLVIANAGCFSLGSIANTPTIYLEKMLDVNLYHYTMMHKVFLPWLIEKRAKQGLKSCVVGTSSVSATCPMPFFGGCYTSTKAGSHYVGSAIQAEMKQSEYSAFIETQVIYPGGTLTGIFNRPESSRFSRMSV